MLVPAAAQGKTYSVNRINDHAPNGCQRKDCTLREAVIAANTRPGFDQIVLRSGKTYRLFRTGVDEDLSLTGDLDVTDDTLIRVDRRRRATINAGGIDRAVETFAQAILRKLVIRNGDTTTGDPNLNQQDGGAVRSTVGSLKLVNTVLAASHAGDDGGGAASTGTRFVAIRSVIRGSEADDQGGGLYLDGDSSLLSNTTVASNRAGDEAGGILAEQPLTIKASTIVRNFTLDDGAGLSIRGEALLLNSTIALNTSEESGGGIEAISGGQVTLASTTIARNKADSTGTASGDGGGIYQGTGTSYFVRNSIIGANTAGGGLGPDCRNQDPGGIVSNGGNLVGSTSGCAGFTGPKDLFGSTNLRLGTLRYRGAATQTISLNAGSAAINRAIASTSPNRDQRGVRRGKRRDAGSYERNTAK